MNFAYRLKELQREKDSLLCVGIVPDITRIPEVFKNPDRLFEWCKNIVDETIPYCSVYKLNASAFIAKAREEELIELISYIQSENALVVLDAQFGNIDNQCAAEAFMRFGADAVILNPLMGYDAFKPYLKYPEIGLIVLCRTANPGGLDLQNLTLSNKDQIYEHIAKEAVFWNQTIEDGAGGRISLVVSANDPNALANVRSIVGDDIPIFVSDFEDEETNIEMIVRAGQTEDGLGMMLHMSNGIVYHGHRDYEALRVNNDINVFRTYPD